MKSQYTVTEKNKWEGETFKYVVEITETEAMAIEQKCSLYGNGTLTIQKSNHSDEDIYRMNTHRGNHYMAYISRYSIQDGAIEQWNEFGECFYKGNGLIKIKKP